MENEASREDQAIAKFKRSTMRTATYRPEDDESLLGEDATPVDGFDSHWGHSERKDSRQTWNMPPGISGHEWATARLAPDCIVADLLFADVGVLIAPGGTGKTTLVLLLAACVALGKDFIGLRVERPGPVLILTSEDSREMLVARLRRVAETLALSPSEIIHLRATVVISDVSGSGFRLTTVINDSVRPDDVVDLVATEAARIKPALVVIDPAVSFGVGEARVNDAEQGLIEAGRRLRRILNCCVLYVHHTGKQNARDGAVDQYAGRGGSAFADGARMVLVLQSLSRSDWKKYTGLPLSDGEQGLIFARPKMSYCRAQQPLYIRRSGYAFELATSVASAEHNPMADAEQVARMVEAELEVGRQHTKNSLEAIHQTANMSRQQMRDALVLALAFGKLVEKELPPEQRKGGKKTYLSLPDPDSTSPNANGEVEAQNEVEAEKFNPADSTPPPLREKKDGEVVLACPIPSLPSTSPNANGEVGGVGEVGENPDTVEVKI